ncbi:hypothetical protein M0802_007545 [Mischocyttarus mexicanus]|nr:hypothetical protein M0802_007545 [Mischocyttarus mexicanus]
MPWDPPVSAPSPYLGVDQDEHSTTYTHQLTPTKNSKHGREDSTEQGASCWVVLDQHQQTNVKHNTV